MSEALHWVALATAVPLTIGCQLLLRVGAKRPASSVNMVTLAGLGVFGLVTVMVVFALQLIELKVAIAFNGLTFIGTPLAEHFFLGEPLDRRTMIGSHIIFAGVLVFLAGG